jgi:hypothetical protein
VLTAKAAVVVPPELLVPAPLLLELPPLELLLELLVDPPLELPPLELAPLEVPPLELLLEPPPLLLLVELPPPLLLDEEVPQGI